MLCVYERRATNGYSVSAKQDASQRLPRVALLFDAGERVGWRFPKERLVLDREPAELPEAVARGDLVVSARRSGAVRAEPCASAAAADSA